jgi:hypothetical protein
MLVSVQGNPTLKKEDNMSPYKDGFNQESATLFTLSVGAGLVFGMAISIVMGHVGFGLLLGLAVGMLLGYLAILSGTKGGKHYQ